ncbi:MAG: M48 family metallopeptidase [Chitinophagales bacterium]|nr:M48 family metallopeptidase [Chitinophagales bacterium]
MNIHYHNIGNVSYRVSSRSKRVNIKLQPFKGVIVSYPPYLSVEQAESVVLKNTPWIKDKLRLMKEREAQYSVDAYYEWKSLDHYYKLRPSDINSCNVIIKDDETLIQYPENLGLKDPVVSEYISTFFEKHLRVSAKKYLPVRLKFLSENAGIRFNKLRINKARTRWGSCSSSNNINLSIYLMLLPTHLADYVILHELAHVKEKNHSRSFWLHLENICPNSRRLDKELNKLKLYIP